MLKTRCFLISLFICPIMTLGSPKLFTLPKPLRIGAGTIPPLCMMHFVGEATQKRSLNLKNDPCLKHKQAYNTEAMKHGLIGYEIKNKKSMKNSSIYYQYIGEIKKHHQRDLIFLIVWSGGGSGQFSHLVSLSLKGNILRLNKNIDGGDRCLGGIHDASINDNSLWYKKNITPLMLMQTCTPHRPLPNSVTLLDCATCCIGTLMIRGGDVSALVFNGIMPAIDINEPMHLCFNRVIQSFGAESKSLLSTVELARLQRTLLKDCRSHY